MASIKSITILKRCFVSMQALHTHIRTHHYYNATSHTAALIGNTNLCKRSSFICGFPHTYTPLTVFHGAVHRYACACFTYFRNKHGRATAVAVAAPAERTKKLRLPNYTYSILTESMYWSLSFLVRSLSNRICICEFVW